MRHLDVGRPTPEQISHHTAKIELGVPIAADADDGTAADVTVFDAQCALVAADADPTAAWKPATWHRRPDDAGIIRDYADISCGPSGDADWPIAGAGDVDMWAQITTATETVALGPFRVVLT